MITIQELVQAAYPDFYQKYEATQEALADTQRWLSDNALTEDGDKMVELMVQSNKLSRLEVEVSKLKRELKALEREANSFNSQYREVVKCAKGVLPLRKMEKLLKSEVFQSSKYRPLSSAVAVDLKHRNMHLNSVPKLKEMYPQFANTSPEIVES